MAGELPNDNKVNARRVALTVACYLSTVNIPKRKLTLVNYT